MSERKSWDIQPRRRTAGAPVSRPTPPPARRPSARPVARPTSKPREVEKKVSHPAPEPDTTPLKPSTPSRHKIPQGKDREPLKARRRRARTRARIILSLLLVFLIVGIFVCIWLPVFRIQHVEAAGTDADGIQSSAQQSLEGTMNYIFPRNSIFFFPESTIRANILAAYPDISAVSISRSSFDSISIDSIARQSAFYWCGTTYAQADSAISNSVTQQITTASAAPAAINQVHDASTTPVVMPVQATPVPPIETTLTCYNADSFGYIYSEVPAQDASSSDVLHVYGSLAGGATTPIGSRISDGSYISNALNFVKAIKSLGVPIVTLVLRNDEADLYVQSGTRITYVLGKESMAAQLAASAFPSLNLNDGSLEYVDLRFDGKVYFKKFGSDAQSTPSQ